jgi:hypothetical protein
VVPLSAAFGIAPAFCLLKVVASGMADYDAFPLDLTQRLPCRNVTSKLLMERMKATTALPIRMSVGALSPAMPSYGCLSKLL